MVDNYLSPLVSCLFCREERSAKGIFTHFQRTHGSDDVRTLYKSGLSSSDIEKIKFKTYDRLIDKLKTYYTNPNTCKGCNDNLDWFNRTNQFCSRSCSANYNNKLRTRTIESNQATSHALKEYHENRKKEFLDNFVGPIAPVANPKPKKTKVTVEIVGDYTKIYVCKCKFCASAFIKSTVKQICDDCKLLQNKLYFQYRFKFNVYHYPDLFDLELLSSKGWYSPKGKSGSWNPHGLSRDHKVSVSEAVNNSYDPYYITHPLNCQLMPQIDNVSKHHRSSITYAELRTLVDKYEKLSGSDSN